MTHRKHIKEREEKEIEEKEEEEQRSTSEKMRRILQIWTHDDVMMTNHL